MWTDEVREVLKTADRVKRLVLVYQEKGAKEVKVIHTFESSIEARVFANQGLPLTDTEIANLLRGRL